MAKFILLDHSLFQLSGHHYSYAVNVLRAAEAQGDQIVLATHVNFRPPADLPNSWHLLRVFTRDAYTLMESWKALHNDDVPAPLSSAALWRRPRWTSGSAWQRWQAALDPRNLLQGHRRQTRRRRHGMLHTRGALEEYVQQCQQVFAAVDVGDDDTVFLPTLTVFDLEPLVSFLRGQGKSCRPAWHLQFHFNFLDGRDPDYAAQDELLTALREHFAAQIQQVAQHRIFFYTTNRPLSLQYDRLGIGNFKPLPFPAVESLRGGGRDNRPPGSERPLRVICTGVIRAEKGSACLESVAHALWKDYLATRRLQFVIQVDRPDFSLSLPGGQKPPLLESAADVENADDPVVFVREPLLPAEYARLIQAADVGLLLYDSQRYYARCSAALVDLLSGGVPVIVPAGCWLSGQIAEQISRHLDRSTAELSALEGREASLESGRTWQIPATATHLALSVRWPQPPAAGVYARLVARQFDPEGTNLHAWASILEQRTGNEPVPVLLPLQPGAAGIQLTLDSAFSSDQCDFSLLDVRFVSAEGKACPLGAVGLTVADHGQLPELFDELTQHYAHYHATAVSFARQYALQHLPGLTVGMLKANQRLASKATPQLSCLGPPSSEGGPTTACNTSPAAA